jgi:hypothetical protein
LSRCDNPAACSGGTARTDRSVCGKSLHRWTRRYSSQRDEFDHAKHIHGFNRGLRVKKGQSPGEAKENFRRHNPALSSLTGLIRCSHQDPPMNQWAIFFRPIGLAHIPNLAPHTPSLRSTSL